MKQIYDQSFYKTSIWIDDQKGFCILASKGLKKDELICVCPVCIVGFDDIKETSKLKNYPIYWTEEKDCISFGIINLLNHSDEPNVTLVNDYDNKIIRAYALRDIKIGEELTIKYKCELWFNPD